MEVSLSWTEDGHGEQQQGGAHHENHCPGQAGPNFGTKVVFRQTQKPKNFENASETAKPIK